MFEEIEPFNNASLEQRELNKINNLVDLKIQFKLGPDGKQPTREHEFDAGWDIYAASDAIWEDNYIAYKTDLFVNIPAGWVGHIYPRSSNTKMDLLLGNSVGTIDSGYTGEIGFRWKLLTSLFHLESEQYKLYKKGDRIGQIVFSKVPTVFWKEVEEFGQTSRSDRGWGSSGK